MIFFAVLSMLVAVGLLLRVERPGGPLAVAHTFARKVDLALDGDVERVVARRLEQRERAGTWAALVGVVLVLAWAVATSSEQTPLAVFAVPIAFFAGHAIGHGLVAWREASRARPSDGPRIARTATPTHGDYVAAHERWGGWVLAGVAALIAVGLAVLDAAGVVLGDLPSVLLVATGVVPLLVMGAYELAAARVLEQRQVAASPLDLARDDALRARTLRDMVSAAIMVGLSLPVALLGVVAERLDGRWPDEPAVGIVNGITLAILGGACVMALVSLALRPQRHFRSRLWREPVVRVDA